MSFKTSRGAFRFREPLSMGLLVFPNPEAGLPTRHGISQGH
jgi:hypothetical protein